MMIIVTDATGFMGYILALNYNYHDHAVHLTQEKLNRCPGGAKSGMPLLTFIILIRTSLMWPACYSGSPGLTKIAKL